MIELESAGLSDPGPNREANGDHIGCVSPTDPLLRQRKGQIFALAGGHGLLPAGEASSVLAVRTLLDEYYSPSNATRVERALGHAMQTANLRVFDLVQRRAEYRAVQTTLSALVMAGAHAYIAHVGDGRVYHWREGALQQLTADHSEAAELMRMRILERDKLRDHPARETLTRVLGSKLVVRPDFLRQEVQAGDQFLLCTRGLWMALEDAGLEGALTEHAPSEACRTLVAQAVSAGRSDSLSLQIVRVQAMEGSAAAAPQEGWLASVLQRLGRS